MNDELSHLVHKLRNRAVADQKKLINDLRDNDLDDMMIQVFKTYSKNLYERENELAQQNGADSSWHFIVPQDKLYNRELYYRICLDAHEYAIKVVYLEYNIRGFQDVGDKGD